LTRNVLSPRPSPEGLPVAIGFEFQIGWHIYKDERRHGFRYQTTVFRSQRRPGWKLTVDCREMEFVVDHVPMPHGRNQLQEQMASLLDYIAALNAKKASKVIKFAEMPDNAALTDGKYNNELTPYVIEPNGQNIGANPQPTAGVRLNRIS